MDHHVDGRSLRLRTATTTRRGVGGLGDPRRFFHHNIFPNVRTDLTNYDNDIYPPNYSGQGFLFLMKQIKTVFLQNSILLRALYPDYFNF